MTDKFPKKLKLRWLRLSLLILLFSTTTRPLHAETVKTTQLPNLPPPQDIQPPTPIPPSPELPQPLPPPVELLPPSQPTTPPSESIPSNLMGTVTVKHFEIVGSTVFSQEELKQEVADFLNRPISLAELYQARSRITDLYVNNGYVTSGAYIPPQSIESGVVKIQVVEGKFERIQISGTQRLSPNYVRDRIKASLTGPVNQTRLLETLQLLQRNPLIQNLSAELSAGSRLGTSVLEVKIKEADTFSTQIVLDNGRSPSVGSFRRRLQVTEANLLGFGDDLTIGYANTDGSNTFDASYTIPVNPRDGTISFSYGTSAANVIEKPFDILDIQAESRQYELTYRQPIVQTPTQEFAVGITASRKESEASYLNEGFGRIPFQSDGADEKGNTRVSAIRFFQEWVSRNNQEVFAVRSQFNLGVGAFDATINQDAPDSRFFSWQGQAQWVRLLAPETLLLLRLNTQLATTTLVPLEQFGVGGQESVRGYRQDSLLADNGVFASAEVQLPILRAGGTLQLIPFADFGLGWNSGTQNPESNMLASAGLGLQWRGGDRFNARIDWGIPLVDVDSDGRTWQENGVYFSVIYNAF
ncbi:ShlB/FhaC/HecB family hemolysin secretion/activation protein [aff. Roholtiella sp. LEGE 12411]|uniref:ShlB/FhaC/HecB family hemolysin secretion/activation protein n=1 Tax=aff. Roholtiella sp. LEGE 12411 TaxID=1828822 RepID=UPI00187E0586|nr:ShlB/FhaC/HecB family hemolysin secretion/activation protein [aff. Roholtiella sp. LEGE 12411]MBE9037012.1 ShlB/FhaC/HecB family hemolysin secretion/activation protein [aff. Roholtiella sp. LEGE 12411]